MSAMTQLFVALAIGAMGAMSGAHAAPPTVQPSPGYDRALAESRRTRTETPVIVAPAAPVAPPRRPAKRHRH